MKKCETEQTQPPPGEENLKSEKPVNDFRPAQLRLSSQTLTHFTHDIRNQLAVINESAGWMQDLLILQEKKKAGWLRRWFKSNKARQPEVGAFLDGLESIIKEVDRGTVLMQRVNDFGHSLRENVSRVDGNAVLMEIFDALERETAEKGIRFKFLSTAQASLLEIDPFVFQWVVYESVLRITRNMKSGETLTVKINRDRERFQVRLTCPCPKEDDRPESGGADNEEFLREIVKELGGRIGQWSDGGTLCTTLTFFFGLTNNKRR